MTRMILGVAALACLLTPSGFAQETGTLRIRFAYGGATAPERSEIDPNKDVEYCGMFDLKDESLIVNPETKGIKNVIVWLDAGRRTKLPDVEPRNETVVLANDQCRFEPHVMVLQTGDTLKITNPDPIGHNAAMTFFANRSSNPMIPAGQSVSVTLDEAEPIPGKVTCSIHPWMNAYVLVKEHPYFGVSDEDGVVEISGLPAGEEYRFRVWQEKSGYVSEVKVDGQDESWRLGRFEREIEPGMNDLGTVVVSPSVFEK